MEDSHVSLTDDDVRERFSALHEGELSPDEARAVRDRIAEDPKLTAEFEAFKRVMGGLAGLASHHDEPVVVSKPSEPTSPEAPESPESLVAPEDEQVDLLGDLQQTLHKKSGGKFYKTRASRVVGTRPLEAAAVATLVVLLLAYVMLTFVSGLRPAEQAPSAPPSAPSR
jgi:anti-sigma factor RsiW